MRAARKLTILFTGLLRGSGLRILGFRWLLGYSITPGSHFGWLNYIDATICHLGKAWIGSDVYFGSRCLVMPDVRAVDRVSIASGTTVSKSIMESSLYVSSQLIKKAEVPDLSTSDQIVEHRGARFVRRDSN
jgi:acetyltransferase-like isoleucine patch superfamily enzyme